MLVNFQHLRKYVDWQGSVEELCDLLTQLGIEVEGVQAPAPECVGLVVGEVLARDPHPNADRLTLCQVEVGEEAPRQIVCGATNHSVGSKVVVALPGQELAGGMRIEKRAVRGIASEGMMCSAREIGLGEEHEGILLLPEDSVVGAPAFPLLCVVELSITPNRPDLLGWIGLAREIAAATGAEIRAPLSHFNSSAEDRVPIRLEDRKGCPRYLGRVVRDVQVAPSPQWLRKAVADLGLSSVNNVVDVTNFVLMEWGQPLHAFDLDRLRGPEICVREAAPGESFVAINHETYTLEADHLVIADKGGAVALAGIMGGEGTEITNHTRNLFIECAYFDPPRIRRGSKSLGLSSDSSFRFERGVDPEALEPVINRCVALILEVAGGRATSGILEACAPEHLPKPRKVAVRGARSTEVIGAHLSESTQADILRRLGCEVAEAESGTIEATIPSYRSDLTKEIDLIEEIARHWGYTNIPYTPPEMSTRVTEVHPVFVLNKRIREFLAPRGWAETKSYSFAHSDCSDRLLLCASSPFRQGIRVQNPISAETETLRTTLLGSLLDTLEVNTRRGERSLRVFEFGKVYPRGVEGLLGAERHALGLAWLGQAPIHWESRGKVFDFFDAKGTCEALFQALGVLEFQIEPFEVEFLHPGQSGRWLAGDRVLGVVGRVHPRVAKNYDLPSDPILVEMDLSALHGAISPADRQVRVPSPFPPIRRDIALEVPLSTSAREVLAHIEGSDAPFLEAVELFDRYLGEQVGPDHQSLAFRLTYRSEDRTLTEEEVGATHADLLAKLREKVGARQRGQESEGGKP